MANITTVNPDINLSQVDDKQLARILQSMYRALANAVNSQASEAKTMQADIAAIPVASTKMLPWLPVLSFGGGTTGIIYAANGQVGWYQVSDNIVTCFMRISLISKGPGVGAAVISGLPLLSMNDAACGMGMCNYNINMASLTSTPFLGVRSNNSAAGIYQQTATGATALSDTNFTNTSGIGSIFHYLTP